MATNRVYMVTKSTAANGAALVMLAFYLGVVTYQGNIKDLAVAIKDDFIGKTGSGPAFWQWAIALIVLYMLAENPDTQGIFGPLLAIMLVAMLIQLAIKQPQVFATLNKGINTILGGATAPPNSINPASNMPLSQSAPKN